MCLPFCYKKIGMINKKKKTQGKKTLIHPKRNKATKDCNIHKKREDYTDVKDVQGDT
jgi:hypothetical protein